MIGHSSYSWFYDHNGFRKNINFTTCDMTSKFKESPKKYGLTISNWNHTNILASDVRWILVWRRYSLIRKFYFWPQWLFHYYNVIHLCEFIEIYYLMWKSEQHRPTPKYEILRSLVPLVENYNVTMEEDDNQSKITCQRCNDFVTCSGRSG